MTVVCHCGRQLGNKRVNKGFQRLVYLNNAPAGSRAPERNGWSLEGLPVIAMLGTGGQGPSDSALAHLPKQSSELCIP